MDEYISIINAPTEDKPMNQTYTVEFLGNVVEGREVKYLNLSIEEMKKYAIKQLEDEKRSEEHTSELQSQIHVVCRLLLEKKKN